jgi:hypothetical protein
MAGVSLPHIEIRAEARLQQVDARDLVHEHAGVDDTLQPAVTAVAEIKHRA